MKTSNGTALSFQDKPMATAGLTSFRYKGAFGWVMIGATDVADALREAQRSVSQPVSTENLQVWSGHGYVHVQDAADTNTGGDLKNLAPLDTSASIKVGDVVAIRGDLRLRIDGSCEYTPEQLVDGKYLKHTGHGGVWTGRVTKIKGDEALVGGGWRHVSRYEVYSA